MLLYILKFSGCLAILLVFYKLFLERENMHVFKRFYLLGALVFSLVVPTLVFTEYVPIPDTKDIVVQPIISSSEVIHVPQALESDVSDIAPVLWGVYFIGLIFFGIKFIKNLFQIFRRIRNNPKQKALSFIQVLLHEEFPPHTFFKFIFLNKVKLESNEIPKEVLLHEETHAKQKHSLDILFIELLQILMWFNPLIYFIRKSIKLNHEFLADSAVLKKGVASSTYQNTLLSFMTPNHQTSLANAINYSSIKKRFTVMKTKTTKNSIVLRSLLILPLTALLLFGFSEKKLVELQAPVKIVIPVMEQVSAVKTIEIRITKKGEILVQNNVLISLDNLKAHLHKINTNLTKAQRENVVRVVIMPDAEPPLQLLKEIEAILIDYGVATIDLIGPEKYANPNQEIRVQKGATKEQITEFNDLAKKYNRQLSKSKHIQIHKSDVERLDYIHGMMTHEQKENAEPFPDFPEPPPAPKAPKAPKVKKGEKSNIPPPPPSASNLSEVEVANKVIDEIIAHQDPYDNINSMQITSKPNKAVTPNNEETLVYRIAPPPTPPTPITPLDHVIEMAKQDATFYYEGKEISSDKAIDLLKKNKNLNIDSRGSKGKPVVRISAQPIDIEN